MAPRLENRGLYRKRRCYDEKRRPSPRSNENRKEKEEEGRRNNRERGRRREDSNTISADIILIDAQPSHFFHSLHWSRRSRRRGRGRRRRRRGGGLVVVVPLIWAQVHNRSRVARFVPSERIDDTGASSSGILQAKTKKAA